MSAPTKSISKNSQMTQPDRLQLLIEHCAGAPIQTGNEVTRLLNGDEIFPAMLAAIESANKTIEFLTFVYWTGDVAKRFADALAKKAREGVTVRILLDAFGCIKIDSDWVEEMRDAGCELRWFRPLKWYSPTKTARRTHRKILICDRLTGFTGGVGIAAEWEGNARDSDEWRDSHFKVRGPAICGLFAAFLHNWNETEGSWDERWLKPCPASDANEYPNHDQSKPAGNQAVQVVCGSSTHGWSNIATAMQIVIRACQKRLYITTGYFQPDEPTQKLLIEAVERGVEVIILHVNEKQSDKTAAHRAGQASYPSLLEGGVKIFEFQPTMLHAKIFIADSMAWIGSANFNQRSMRHDEEVVLTSSDDQLIEQLLVDFHHDCSRSKAITLNDWQQRSWWHKLTAKILTFWSRHL